MTNSMELALRSAVITANKDFSKGADQFAEIEKNALRRAQEWSGKEAASNSAASSSQSDAIKVALKALSFAYTTASQHLSEMKNKRLSFDMELAAGIVTFTKSKNKENRDLSTQERVMTNFFNLINEEQNKEISNYFGIHFKKLEDERVCYSTLPFYSMQLGNMEQGNSRILDKKRKKTYIFINQIVPKFLKTITEAFEQANKITSFWKSITQKENYLNDLRAARFIIISLANLLWNLQHPVDGRRGLSLDLASCNQVCRTALTFLNQLLNVENNMSIHDISTEKNQLLIYGRRIERYTMSLLKGYQSEEVLGELNIAPICDNASFTLDSINNSIFELIYSYYNPVTKKREAVTAAKDMVEAVNNLNQLIQGEEGLLRVFLQPENPFYALNDKITSIMDVLIIFVHCTKSERELIYKKLAAIKSDNADDFKNSLKEFYRNFIEPIERINKIKLKVSSWDDHWQNRSAEVARVTAKELLPLISLLLYNDDVDVEVEYNEDLGEEKAIDPSKKRKKYDANKQIKMINSMAENNDYYQWSLPLLTPLTADVEKKLAKLLKQQLRFSKLIKLLDYVKEIVKNYRTFLHEEAFHTFLKHCLEKVEKEFNLLATYIKDIDTSLSKTRTMTAILDDMEQQLSLNLQVCMRVTTTIKTLIDNPDFIEKQKQLLSEKFSFIDKQYFQLFHEKSGIAPLIRKCSKDSFDCDSGLFKRPTEYKRPRLDSKDEQKSVKSPLGTIDHQKFQMLQALVQACYNVLSYRSKHSEKGWALHNLLDCINSNLDLTVFECNRMIKELARIALKPRKSYFFEAAYAKTRSTKPLLKALKDPKQNNILSLSALILGVDGDLSQESEAQIVQRLQAANMRFQYRASPPKDSGSLPSPLREKSWR